MVNRLIPSVGGNPILVYYYDGSDWRPALLDTDGHLQIDVLSTVMDAAAATAANQALILAQLQLIEDMRDALQSVNTDRLLVRGMDQLHSYKGSLCSQVATTLVGASGYIDTASPPAGEAWLVTNIRAADTSNPTTRHLYAVRRGTSDYWFHEQLQAFATGAASIFHGFVWVEPSDTIRCFFAGGSSGDNCTADLTGHRITLET